MLQRSERSGGRGPAPVWVVRDGFCEEVTPELNSEEEVEVKVSRKSQAVGTAYAKALGWELRYRTEEAREDQFGCSAKKAEET